MLMRLLSQLLYTIACFLFPRDVARLRARLKAVHYRYCARLRHRISPVLIEVLVAGEDQRFFQHYGLDMRGLIRAFWRTVVEGRIEGGSTLEQQLWRTITNERHLSLRRKAREILFASVVGRVVPKNDIPGTYLSIAYMGWRMNGVEQACEHLGYCMESLALHQAAGLVARLKYPQPRHVSPVRTSLIRARQDYLVRLVGNKPASITGSSREVPHDAALPGL